MLWSFLLYRKVTQLYIYSFLLRFILGYWISLPIPLESPLDCKEIKPVNPKGNQSWIFIGSTDAKAEAPTLWPPDVKNWLLGKDPDSGKDWRQEKGTTEDEMVGWHHWLNRHEFEQAPGVGNGQGGMDREAWRAAVHGVKRSQTWLSDWTELNWIFCTQDS